MASTQIEAFTIGVMSKVLEDAYIVSEALNPALLKADYSIKQE